MKKQNFSQNLTKFNINVINLTFMITVPEVVQDIIQKTPFLEEGLQKNIINLSSLARYIKPEVEERTFKEVGESAIVMALQTSAT
jgi:hypothetical protein